MGTFHEPIEITSLEGRTPVTLQALVDTGATYLTVAAPVLDSLGARRLERRPFLLADGRSVEHDVGLVSLRIDGRSLPVLCVFGERGGEPLLGAVALETFGLAVDPVRRGLVPVPELLM